MRTRPVLGVRSLQDRADCSAQAADATQIGLMRQEEVVGAKGERAVRDDIFRVGEQAAGLRVLDDEAGVNGDGLSADERATALREVTFLKGCLWWSAEVLIDQIFGDLDEDNIDDTAVLSALPGRYHHLMDRGFARHFLVAAIDQTSGMGREWTRPKCVAQELFIGLLMDNAGVTAELFGITLPADWRGYCIDALLWEDDDYMALYEPELDGVWNDDAVPVGMADMDFSKWFKPFDTERDRMMPYLASGTRPEPQTD